MRMTKGSGYYCLKCGTKLETELVPITEIYPYEDEYCPITGQRRMLVVDTCPNTTEDDYFEHFRAINQKPVLVGTKKYSWEF
jgi:hypothetical protein